MRATWGGDVHRAARIAAAGHGGQILVSASTAAVSAWPRAASTWASTASRTWAAAERVYQLGGGTTPAAQRRSTARICPSPRPRSSAESSELPEVVALLAARTPLAHTHRPGRHRKNPLAMQAAAEAADASPTASSGCRWRRSAIGARRRRPSPRRWRSGRNPTAASRRPSSSGSAGSAALVAPRQRRAPAPRPAERRSPSFREEHPPDMARDQPERLSSRASTPTRSRPSTRGDGVALFLAARAARRRYPRRDRPGAEACVLGSTTCRWRSSSPPPERTSSPPSSSSSGCRNGSTCSAAATRIPASRRSERRSSGRTICSSARSDGCSARSPCSPAAASRGGRGGLRGRPGPAAVAARQEPATPRASAAGPLLDARDDPRVCGGAARGPRTRTSRSGAGTPSTTSPSRAPRTSPPRPTGLSATTSCIPERDNMRAALSVGARVRRARARARARRRARELLGDERSLTKGLEWATTFLEEADANVTPASSPRALRVQGGMRNRLSSRAPRSSTRLRGELGAAALAIVARRSATTGPSPCFCTGSRTRPCDEATVQRVPGASPRRASRGHRRAGQATRRASRQAARARWRGSALREGDPEQRAGAPCRRAVPLPTVAGFRWWHCGHARQHRRRIQLELGRLDERSSRASGRR